MVVPRMSWYFVTLVALLCCTWSQVATLGKPDWCQQANVTCSQNCARFGDVLQHISFDCKNSTSVDTSAVVQAATCTCLGVDDAVLSSFSSSESRNSGGGGQASASSFASSSGL